jgi:cytoskeletal protein CcmA (bactofilin family)
MIRQRRLAFAATALAAMVFLPMPGGLDVFDSSIFLLVEDDVQDEDAYVLTDNGIVAGVIEGDLVTAAGRLTISGTVTGDVLVASAGSVTISGTVLGAVRGAARTVEVEESGVIGDDLAVAALTTRIRGSVGRDAIVFGGTLDLTGDVGRDLHGRFVRGDLDGGIGRNADISTRSLEVGAGAVVGGSLLYRSNRSADVDPSAAVTGNLTQISPRPSFFVDVWWTLATILGFLSFVFTGILLLWLLRDTSSRAVEAIVSRPWRTLLFGLAALVLVPLVIVSLVVSFVGVPVAILLGVLYLLGFFFGPIPAVVALGSRLPGGRGSVFGAFVVGAIVWRLGIFLLSFVAGALYVAALVWGVGGWAATVWDGRSGAYSSASVDSTTANT